MCVCMCACACACACVCVCVCVWVCVRACVYDEVFECVYGFFHMYLVDVCVYVMDAMYVMYMLSSNAGKHVGDNGSVDVDVIVCAGGDGCEYLVMTVSNSKVVGAALIEDGERLFIPFKGTIGSKDHGIQAKVPCKWSHSCRSAV